MQCPDILCCFFGSPHGYTEAPAKSTASDHAEGYGSYESALWAAEDAADSARRLLELHRAMQRDLARIDALADSMRTRIGALESGTRRINDHLCRSTQASASFMRDVAVHSRAATSACTAMINSYGSRIDRLERQLASVDISQVPSCRHCMSSAEP